MPILILARHGRTEANASGRLAGRTPGVHLDDVGQEQVRRAASRLAEVDLVRAVTSPLERCQQTATALLGESKVEASIEPDLNEVDYGDWSNRLLKDLSREALWQTVQRQPSAAIFPAGESLAAMSARAVGAVRRVDAEVAAASGESAIWLAVSHGDVIKAILADALGMHLDSFQRLIVQPASLSVVQYTAERTFVHAMNTTDGSLSHLTPRREATPGGERA